MKQREKRHHAQEEVGGSIRRRLSAKPPVEDGEHEHRQGKPEEKRKLRLEIIDDDVQEIVVGIGDVIGEAAPGMERQRHASDGIASEAEKKIHHADMAEEKKQTGERRCGPALQHGEEPMEGQRAQREGQQHHGDLEGIEERKASPAQDGRKEISHEVVAELGGRGLRIERRESGLFQKRRGRAHMKGEVPGIAAKPDVAVGVRPHADGEIGRDQNGGDNAGLPEFPVKDEQRGEPAGVPLSEAIRQGIEGEHQGGADGHRVDAEAEGPGQQEHNPRAPEAAEHNCGA